MAIRERKPNKRNASINEINTYNYVNTEPNQHMVYRLKNKKSLSILVNSKFPIDFFEQKPDSKDENFNCFNKKNRHSKFDSEEIGRNSQRLRINNMKLSIQLGKKDNSANQCLITDIDDEYEDDKKLIELLSDNYIKKENKKGNDVLIQSLSQKKKKDLKREMIPEVNESKCKTKKVSVIDSEILINNDTLIIDNDSFIENKLKQKGYWKKTLSPILHLPSLTTEQVIPIAKTNRKVLIDAFNKVKDKEGKNNTPISSNVQTESNSSQSNRSNSSIAKRISPESSNTNIKEQQLLAQDIDQLIYEINEYKDDPIIKEKLEMIMMNIAEIKTAFMTRDKNRSNLVSAPSSSVKKNSLTQKECLPLLQENTKGKKERIEEIKRHYLKDNFKVVNMSQRRRHVTAPIKLFHMKN